MLLSYQGCMTSCTKFEGQPDRKLKSTSQVPKTYTLSFCKQYAYKQHQPGIKKNLAKAKQHPEAELFLLFEILLFLHPHYHPKIRYIF